MLEQNYNHAYNNSNSGIFEEKFKNLQSWVRNPDLKANLWGWEQTKGWWWPISTSLCSKVQRVADWPKVNCGEETKEKLFVCSVATPLRLIRHRHIIHFFSKTNLHCYPQTLRPLMSFWRSFAWQGWMAQNIVFLCLKTDSAQISTLAGKCFCGLFDFIVESNLCGHKTGFKRMSRRRNIYFGEQPDDLVVKS